MSLKPTPIGPVPELTAYVARAAFPDGNPFLRLRDQLGTLVCSNPAGFPYWHRCREEICFTLESLTSQRRLFPPASAEGFGTSCGFDR